VSIGIGTGDRRGRSVSADEAAANAAKRLRATLGFCRRALGSGIACRCASLSTRLSCHRFRANQVRLRLSVIAYNLGNLWRRLALPKRIDTCPLTKLQPVWQRQAAV